MRKKPKLELFKLPFKELNIVWWQDAYVTTDDKPQLDIGDNLTVSVGVKVGEDSGFIYLSHFYDGITKAHSSPYTAIPREMIRKTKVCKVR